MTFESILTDGLAVLHAKLAHQALNAPEPKMRRLSSSEVERLMPGSPWRPERPRSWLLIRRDSWRSSRSPARQCGDLNAPPAEPLNSSSRAS